MNALIRGIPVLSTLFATRETSHCRNTTITGKCMKINDDYPIAKFVDRFLAGQTCPMGLGET